MVALKKKKPELRSRADISALTAELEWHDKLVDALGFTHWRLNSNHGTEVFATITFDGNQSARFKIALDGLLEESRKRLLAMGYDPDA